MDLARRRPLFNDPKFKTLSSMWKWKAEPESLSNTNDSHYRPRQPSSLADKAGVERSRRRARQTNDFKPITFIKVGMANRFVTWMRRFRMRAFQMCCHLTLDYRSWSSSKHWIRGWHWHHHFWSMEALLFARNCSWGEVKEMYQDKFMMRDISYNHNENANNFAAESSNYVTDITY